MRRDEQGNDMKCFKENLESMRSYAEDLRSNEEKDRELTIVMKGRGNNA